MVTCAVQVSINQNIKNYSKCAERLIETEYPLHIRGQKRFHTSDRRKNFKSAAGAIDKELQFLLTEN